jgi:DNA-binding response OmpR family regulator
MAVVLVADSSTESRRALRLLLERGGHRVIEAEDGDQAHHVIATDEFELAVVYAMLPKSSGFALCREIRGSARVARARVVLTFERERAGDRSWSLRQGADEIWVKPLDGGQVAADIERLLAGS